MPAATGVTKVIDSKGHWLTPAAAESYLRMVTASGNLPGLVSAGRTRAEQERLYYGYTHHLPGFNLAARPGTSRHETGQAIDVQTGSPLQRWMTKGSRYDKVTRTGTTRASEYGWFRTVPSEAWHFQYFVTRDKHRNDKPVQVPVQPVQPVQPPVVVTPPVATPPVVLLPTLARIATLNCHGWNVPEKAWTARERHSVTGEILRLNCSIVALTECPEYMRDAIRDALPGGRDRWRVVTRGDQFHQAVLFDNRKWKFVSSKPVEFGPTPYHGGVWATFTQTITKATLAVGAYHLPPNVVASGTTQARYMKGFLEAAPKVNARLAGGDGMDTSSWAAGWNDARINAAASINNALGTYGNAIRDRIVTLGITHRRYTVGPTIVGTDHRSVLAQITIPANLTTN